MKQLYRPVKNFFTDSSGSIVIWQTPNALLSGWFVFAVIARIVTSGFWHQLATVFGFVCITIWAMQETTQGASPFRRVLGALILIASVWSKLTN